MTTPDAERVEQVIKRYNDRAEGLMYVTLDEDTESIVRPILDDAFILINAVTTQAETIRQLEERLERWKTRPSHECVNCGQHHLCDAAEQVAEQAETIRRLEGEVAALADGVDYAVRLEEAFREAQATLKKALEYESRPSVLETIRRLEGEVARLQSAYDALTGEKFSDRVHVALKQRLEAAEAELARLNAWCEVHMRYDKCSTPATGDLVEVGRDEMATYYQVQPTAASPTASPWIRYAWHDAGCGKWEAGNIFRVKNPCTCGLTSLLGGEPCPCRTCSFNR